MKNFIFAILVSTLAASQAGVIDASPNDVIESYSVIDSIIKALLESMRSKLADLKINDINEAFTDPSFNATVNITDIFIKNADKFEIKTLKSSLIPLKLNNLTLTWNEVIANADYDLNAVVGAPTIQNPFRVFGKGNAKAILNNLYFTIGANLELKDNAIQIKPKGLFNFDLRIEKADVTITSLMGSTDLGNAVGVLISKIIPEATETLKNPLFNAFQDDIIRIINQILKNKKELIVEEQVKPLMESSESSLNNLDFNEEMGNLFNQWLDLGLGVEKTEEEISV